MEDRLALEFISVFGQPPVDYIATAAQLGVRQIGMAIKPIVTLDGLYPAWNLREDAALRRDTARALEDNGVSVVLGEGFLIMPGIEVEAYAADIDVLAQLGAGRLNVVCIAADAEKFGTFADMAAAHGLTATVEFLPGLGIDSFDRAAQFLAEVGRPNTGILVDAMHFFASGGSAAALAGADPALIAHAQLCDMLGPDALGDYTEAARFERAIPGGGVLPLSDFISALPGDVLIGLEAPLRAQALGGIGPVERLAPAVARARALIESGSVLPVR